MHPILTKNASIQGILRLQTHDSLVGIELKSLCGTFSIEAFLRFQDEIVKSYRVLCRVIVCRARAIVCIVRVIVCRVELHHTKDEHFMFIYIKDYLRRYQYLRIANSVGCFIILRCFFKLIIGLGYGHL